MMDTPTESLTNDPTPPSAPTKSVTADPGAVRRAAWAGLVGTALEQYVPKSPVGEVFRHGRKPMLLVLFMNVGISAQSYTYQVFMASYLVSTVGVDASFVPKVLMIGAACGGLGAIGFGILSDRVGRRPVYSAILAALVLLPGPSFIALNTGSPIAITVTMILGFVLAAQGAVGVQMSYFPELFGSRYRYAGVTLGREFSSVLGGGVAPLICASLLTAFSGSWIPVAAYMTLMMVISLVAARLAPETRNRDLLCVTDATSRPSATTSVTTESSTS
ncbi:hypothetical protein AB0H86_20685 [Streptomyces sp. NPDC050997]|uniref:hypothetical protein n=1 Tax=Streptomyces sp. NPDC050997 TaxID=3155519 RepID=UPI00344A36D6